MQRYTEIKNNGFTLRGMIHQPDDVDGKVPMVIFFHGFTATKSEHYFSFVETSRELETLGIASARFDFMGSGESDGVFEDMSVETEVSDGIAILNHVRNLSFVDPGRIALVGMSFGGLVASLLAGRMPSHIRALCLWAPAAIAIKDAIEGHAQGTDITRALTHGIADIRGHRIGKRFVEDARSIDLKKELSSYKNKAMIIWGSNDPIVPPETLALYGGAYGERLESVKIEGVGHMFESLSAREMKLAKTLEFLKKELLVCY